MSRNRRAAIAAGRWERDYPVEQVRAWVAKLGEAGMVRSALAARTGVALGTINQIYRPTAGRQRVRPTVARAILDVPLPDRTDRTVPVIGVARRTNILALEGYSAADTAALLRCGSSTIRSWWNGKARTVSESVVQAVHQVYVARSATPGPSSCASTTARRRGFVLNRGFWPDETIDDPDYHPHNLVIPVGARRRLRAMAREGRPVHTIAARLNEPAAAVSAWTEGAPVPAYAAVHIGRVYEQGWGADPLFDRDRAAYADYMGWPGGIAWDGWDIDNPMTSPAGVRDADMREDGHAHRQQDSVNVRLVEQALDGLVCVTELTLAERVIVVSDLSDRRWSNQQIGDHLYWGQNRKARRDLAGYFIRQHRIRSTAALAA